MILADIKKSVYIQYTYKVQDISFPVRPFLVAGNSGYQIGTLVVFWTQR